MSKHSYSEEELKEAVRTSSSYAQVLKKLGLVPRGGNYQTLKKRIRKLGLDTSHMTHRGWSKDRKLGPRKKIEYYLVAGKLVQSNKLRKRLIREGLLEPKCNACGITEWRGEPAPLELDHINGDRYDNRLENLRILCPNCHAQTETYRGRNAKISKIKKHGKRVKSSGEISTPKTQPVYKCLSCEKEISPSAKRCRKCARKARPGCKIIWPPTEVLIQKVKETSYCAVARELGVSDNAVRKRIRNHS